MHEYLSEHTYFVWKYRRGFEGCHDHNDQVRFKFCHNDQVRFKFFHKYSTHLENIYELIS